MNIVVIEDNEDVRAVLVVWLQRQGHTVFAPEPSREWLSEAFWEGIDIALVDLALGSDLTGTEVLTYLAEHAPHVRRVIETARSNVPTDAALLADRVIKKPFDFDELMDVLDE